MGSARVFVAVAVLVACAREAVAHEGPPYPILVDQKAGPYLVSVWSDPDVGKSTFFVTFDPPPAIGAEPRVEIDAAPLSGSVSARKTSAMRRAGRVNDPFYAELDCPTEEVWRFRFAVDGPLGAGEVSAEVAVTPPGYGSWDLVIYGAPFLLLGGVWALAAVKRRASAKR